MAKKNTKKRRFASAAAQNGFKKGKKGAKNSEDEFFENDTKRRRNFEDENIESSSDEDGWEDDNDGGDGGENQDVAAEEETVGEVRKRVAAEIVNRLRRAAEKQLEEGKDDDDDDDGDNRDKELERDSLVGNILMQNQLEKSGRVRRSIASSVCPPQTTSGFQVLVKHLQPVTAVALSEDDSKGFSASKDGNIFHWDVHSGKKEQYAWPSEEVLKAHGAKAPEGRAKKRSKAVLALAVSSDGRYLASGGFDRHVHLWDTRTREHIQAFSGHKGSVSCLAFRQGTSELFSGSYDRTIKIWNAEDRSYITTLFGHQSEVLTIDCLRKERALTVGRDRTMHLWKVPEESQLVFRAPASSLECCCFINNDEFLSGSDDGSIEHWSVLRKKPLHILKNAHALSTPTNNKGQTDNLLNGSNGFLQHSPESTHSSTQSWVGSVAVCRSSDLAASGAGNGFVRLWQIESDSKGIKPLFELPLVGYVNSLAFASSGSFLAAGVGKEPRLGRWGSLRDACNGVYLHPLRPS